MKPLVLALLAFLGAAATPDPANAAAPVRSALPATYLVTETAVSDEKAVFATIESTNVVPARVRTGGTITELKVRQGDQVEQGQVIATIGDPKLALQINSFAAQVKAAQAQLAQAKVEYERAQKLVASGAISRNAFDQARTAYNVAQSNVRAIASQRDVVAQQETEGKVLAPASGRVITVPVTVGTVVMAGDPVATVAAHGFVLRLQIPERHARYLKTGDPVRLDGEELGLAGPQFGTISLVYPDVQNGHVVADATVVGLKDYFVGQRVRVWVRAGMRKTIVVPASYILTRSGIDYARVRTAGGTFDIPVQRGQMLPRPQMPDGLEVLSGLRTGDRLIHP